MPNVYDTGDKIRLTATFTVDDAVTDPTTVTVKVLDPSSNETSATPTNPSTGVYYYDVSLDEAGDWYYRFEGTGAAVAAEEVTFNVRASKF